MTGVRVELRADEALGVLAAALAKARNPRGLYDAIGLSLVTSTQRRFEQERGPDGSPWPPSIRAQLEGGRTLFETGRLSNSITHEATDQGVAVGTNVLYGAIHQFGGTIRPVAGNALKFRIGGKFVTVASVTIPARPFLGIDAEDEAELPAIAQDWLDLEDGDAR